jgi:hypothetical protein
MSDDDDDLALLPQPVTIPRARYRYKAGAPCAFCSTAKPDATVHVDLNWPLVDVTSTRDASIADLPCCARCRARHLRADNFCTSIPRTFGYPASTLHRLLYVPRVRGWLRAHAEAEPVRGAPPETQVRAMRARYQWVLFFCALWASFGLAAMGGYPEAAPLRGTSYLVFFWIVVFSAICFVSALIQLARLTLPGRR